MLNGLNHLLPDPTGSARVSRIRPSEISALITAPLSGVVTDLWL